MKIILNHYYYMKSTIDWCELNYIESEYIAEYWNSITGFFLIMSGILFYKFNKDLILQNNIYIENKFKTICNLLILVGIGTILFHSTLLYPFQLLDEIPMILLASEYIKILLQLNIVQTMFKQNILQYLKIITKYVPFVSIIISLSYFINIYLQISIFHITLKITEISVLFILYNLSLNLNKISYDIIYTNHNTSNKLHTSNYESLSILYNKNNMTNDSKYTHLINVQNDILEYIKIKKNISTLNNSALYYYGVSMSLWAIENLFCNYVHFLQLHALWHILSSIGVYKLNQIILNYVLINNLLYKNKND